MKSLLAIAFLGAALGCATVQLPPPSDSVDLVFATTTDVHGRIRAWDYYANQEERVRGLTRAATIVDSRDPAGCR